VTARTATTIHSHNAPRENSELRLSPPWMTDEASWARNKMIASPPTAICHPRVSACLASPANRRSTALARLSDSADSNSLAS
jgi:hypothetical protein